MSGCSEGAGERLGEPVEAGISSGSAGPRPAGGGRPPCSTMGPCCRISCMCCAWSHCADCVYTGAQHMCVPRSAGGLLLGGCLSWTCCQRFCMQLLCCTLHRSCMCMVRKGPALSACRPFCKAVLGGLGCALQVEAGLLLESAAVAEHAGCQNGLKLQATPVGE